MKEITVSERLFNIFIYCVLFLAVSLTIYPFLYTISMSLSGVDAIRKGIVWLYPRELSLETYSLVLQRKDMWVAYYNTLRMVFWGVLLTLSITMTAAYALSVKDFFARKIAMKLIIFTMFFSGGFITLFILIVNLKLYNTLWAVVLPSATGAWYIIITRVYIESTISQSLYESAKIEGCSHIGIFLRIVVPLSKTIMAVLTLFSAVAFWNMYFSPLIFIVDKSLRPLSLYLQSLLLTEIAFSEQGMTLSEEQAVKRLAYGARLRYASIIITTLPIICVYPFVQKYFVKGIMIGSIKE